ncbi:hypothetical protein SLA2020_012570 [Shorea laevis]
MRALSIWMKQTEVDVGGVGKPEREGVEGSDRDDRGEVEAGGHGGGELDEAENVDEKDGEGGAEAHVDEGEGNWVGPVVHLAVEDILVVDDDGEGKEDPDGHIGVGEDNFLDYGGGEGGGGGGGGGGGCHGGWIEVQKSGPSLNIWRGVMLRLRRL